MKQYWWKILGVLLMFYVLVAGLIVPLKPGILNSSPTSAEAGKSVSVTIDGYNTNFKSAKENQVFLKFDENQILKASLVDATSETMMNVKFDIPKEIQTNKKIAEATLIIDNELDGPALLPAAMFVKGFINAPSNVWVGDIRESMHVKSDFAFPFRNILYETVRNTFFHVAIWMAMFILLTISVFHSIMYLINRKEVHDFKTNGYTSISIVYGLIGLATGAMWAKHTWGTYWTNDIKLNMAAIAMLLYTAYWLLRSSIEDVDSRARLSCIYNIFAYSSLIPLLFVIPRLTDSLHPGNGGNPALGGEDLDNTLRMVFYPAIIALSLIGGWAAQLYWRYLRAENLSIEQGKM